MPFNLSFKVAPGVRYSTRIGGGRKRSGSSNWEAFVAMLQMIGYLLLFIFWLLGLLWSLLVWCYEKSAKKINEVRAKRAEAKARQSTE